jgi:hypothetical protein
VVRVTSGSNKRVPLAALLCARPGCRTRLIYRVHAGRGPRKDQRKGFTEADYARLLDAAHQQLGSPLVVVPDNLSTHISCAMVLRQVRGFARYSRCFGAIAVPTAASVSRGQGKLAGIPQVGVRMIRLPAPDQQIQHTCTNQAQTRTGRHAPDAFPQSLQGRSHSLRRSGRAIPRRQQRLSLQACSQHRFNRSLWLPFLDHSPHRWQIIIQHCRNHTGQRFGVLCRTAGADGAEVTPCFACISIDSMNVGGPRTPIRGARRRVIRSRLE